MGSGPLDYFRRERRERELDEEIRAHIEMDVAGRLARGESREEAERAAWREFGNEARVREVTRTMWGHMWWDRLVQDVRFAVRSLRRDPSFLVAAAVILTVGIGANAIVFTLAKSVMLDEPAAVTEPSRLVRVSRMEEADWRDGSWTYADYAFVRSRSSAFSGLLAYESRPYPVALDSSEGSTQAGAWVVSDNFFDVLGSPMMMGRGFLPEEGLSPGAAPVAVLSHGLWERHFGSDRDVLGSTLTVNGTTFVVVGVAAPDFRGISPIETPPDLYVPLMMMGVLTPVPDTWVQRVDGEVISGLLLVGRLADGVSVDAAAGNMAALTSAWDTEFGGWAARTGVDAFQMGISGDYRFSQGAEAERLRQMIGYLAAVVGAVLLIACANLALLLLARAPARRGEMGVRSAMGAGRARIVRQLLTEGMVLAGLGGVGGLALAAWGSAAVAALLPFDFAVDFLPDPTVLLYTGVVTLVVTAVFGLVPALHAARTDIAGILRGEGRVAPRWGARNALVVGQVAASVVLVAGAGLFVRSLLAANTVDLGFDPDDRLVVSVSLSNHGYGEVDGRAFIDRVLQGARSLPGVDVAAVTARAPFGGRWQSTARPEGTEQDEAIPLNFNRAGAGYFEVMGMPIVAGRPIDERDVQTSPPVMIVNETTAERYWPGESAIGKSMLWRDRTWTIVGVAADAKYYTIADEPTSQVYVSPSQDYDGFLYTFVLRTSVPAADLAAGMRSVIARVDPGVAVFGVQTLRDVVGAQTASYRAMAVLVGTFGVVALLMAAVGLYGVLAYLVRQSLREIGIRMALGASAERVANGVLGRGAKLAVLGLAIGGVTALALSDLVRSMLFGIEPNDPATILAAMGALLVVGLVASWVPARRASRVDAMVAIRAE